MSKNQEKSKELYVVRIYRRDGEIVDFYKSSVFKTCKDKWKALYQQWQECHEQKKVFVLETPVVTAFEPGLISEILVIPYTDPVQQVQDDNPYKQQMQSQGLNNTLRGAGQYPDLLDGGYNN